MGRNVVSKNTILGRLSLVVLFSLAFVGMLGETAAACDETGVTCFDNTPEYEQVSECDRHLVAQHVQAWVDCEVGWDAASVFDQSSLPEISPGGYVRVTVTIQRNGPSTDAQSWGFRVQEGIAGIGLDGDALTQGSLDIGTNTVVFSFNLTVDASTSIEGAVVGVAFWGAEHQVDQQYMGIDVIQARAVSSDWTFWMAFFALLVATIALVVAILAWRARP